MPSVIINQILQFLIIIPILLGLACYQRSLMPIKLMGVLFLVYSLDSILLHLPKISFFSDFMWNWQGKLLEFIWPLLAVFLGLFKAKELGLQSPITRFAYIKASLTAFTIVVTGIIITLYFQLGLPPAKDITLETLLYQFTLPGLGEEILFRGVLWTVVNRYISSYGVFDGIKLRWALVITSVLFTAAHLISVDSYTHKLIISWDNLIILPIGIILGLYREKTKSIWPGILLHNLLNGLFVLFVGYIYVR